MKAKGNSSATDSQDPRRELPALLFEMGRLLKSEINRDGSQVLSFLHFETLRFIQNAEKPTMSDVAKYLKITRPSATVLINTFVKDGIIDRTVDPTDRRVVRLSLSTEGTLVIKATMRGKEKAFARVTASLSNADCQELARILRTITHCAVIKK